MRGIWSCQNPENAALKNHLQIGFYMAKRILGKFTATKIIIEKASPKPEMVKGGKGFYSGPR